MLCACCAKPPRGNSGGSGAAGRAAGPRGNPLKSKQLTNFRSTGKDDAVRLTPPRKMTLEQAIAYIQDDELVEVTPQSVRLRKRYLDPHERKKMARKEG